MTPLRSALPRRRAFTLIECIIVVVLAGLVLMFAYPKLSRGLAETGVRAARNRFASTHARARALAMRYGRTSQLVIDPSAAKFWV